MNSLILWYYYTKNSPEWAEEKYIFHFHNIPPNST